MTQEHIGALAVSYRPILQSFIFLSSPQLFDFDHVGLDHDTIVLSKLEVFRGCASAEGRGYVLVLCRGSGLLTGVTPRQGKHREGRADYGTG